MRVPVLIRACGAYELWCAYIKNKICAGDERQNNGFGIRQHAPAYVSIRQHTSAYVSIRQHKSAETNGFEALHWRG